MSDKQKLKPFPKFESDEEAERFVEEADLSKFDFSGFKPMRFELRKKDKTVNIRLSDELLKATKDTAEAEGIPYQRFIRDAIERAVHGARRHKKLEKV